MAQVENGNADNDATKKAAEKEAENGIIVPERLRREFLLTAMDIKDADKLLEHVKGLPGVVEASYVEMRRHKKGRARKICVIFKDTNAAESLSGTNLHTEHGYIVVDSQQGNGSAVNPGMVSNHTRLMKRPFILLNKLHRFRLREISMYARAFQDDKDNILNRQAIISVDDELTPWKAKNDDERRDCQLKWKAELEAKGFKNLESKIGDWSTIRRAIINLETEAIRAKWRKAFEEDWGFKEALESIKHFTFSSAIKMIIVQFKSHSAAKDFVLKSADLELDGQCVRAELITKVGDVIRLRRTGDSGAVTNFLTGSEDENSLDADKTVVAMAFKKGMELREQAKDLFVANNAVKVSELEFGASRFLEDDPIQPMLLATFDSKAELDEALLALDTINNNKSYNELVFAMPLNIFQQEKQIAIKNIFNAEPESPEAAKRCLIFKDNVVEINFKNRKGENQDGSNKEATNGTGPAAAEDEMAEWVTCTLDRNPNKIRWDSRDSNEIGRYFFENHENVAEIKMRHSCANVYVRFHSSQAAAIFIGLPYVLFLGVKVKRAQFSATTEFKNRSMRIFLGGKKQVDLYGPNKSAESTTSSNGKGQPGSSKWEIHLQYFKVKLTNAVLFNKLNEEIGLDRPVITQGMWDKVKLETGDEKWKAIVSGAWDEEECERFVLNWNEKEVNINDAVIKAELKEGRVGKKRRQRTDNQLEIKRARKFIENY